MLSKRYFFTLAAAMLVGTLTATPALAAKKQTPVETPPPVAPYEEDGTKLPNVVSLGAGWFDFDKNSPQKEALDMRAEYRWGASLLPMVHNYFTGWDKYFQVHPMVGLETTHRGQVYGFGGFAFDVLLGRHVILTESENVGLYYRGDGKRLGSFVEFRSQLEAGWRFDNEMRATAFVSHISNAGLTDLNPGANSFGAYLHIPTRILFSGR